MEDPSRQEAPAQTTPATQHSVIGRLKNLGPVAVIATGAVIALPLAEHEFGIRPTILGAGITAVVIGSSWLITRQRERMFRGQLDRIERTLTAASAGAFDPATQEAIRSINRELAGN